MDIPVSVWIQMVTESLPVSSSGHVLISSIIYGCIPYETIWYALAHAPTLVALSIWWPRMYVRTYVNAKRHTVTHYITRVMIAAASTVCVYSVLSRVLAVSWCVESSTHMVMASIGWITTALCIMYVVLNTTQCRAARMPTYAQAFIIGALQGCSYIPGLSRMALSTALGVAVGMTALESFIYSTGVQAIICGGAVVKGLYNAWMHDAYLFMPAWHSIGITFLGGVIVAYTGFVVTTYLLCHRLWWVYSCYTVLLGIVALIIATYGVF